MGVVLAVKRGARNRLWEEKKKGGGGEQGLPTSLHRVPSRHLSCLGVYQQCSYRAEQACGFPGLGGHTPDLRSH